MEDTNAFAQFQQNPSRYLQNVRDSPPSQTAATRLANSVAASLKSSDTGCLTASLYLQAAARHLPAMRTTAPVGGNAPDAETKSSQIVTQIVEAVGHAVTRCQPRSLIVQSGILPVLAHFLPPAAAHAQTNNNNNITIPALLTVVHVEFLQACVCAGHYVYAEQHVGTTTWPRPTAGTVAVVHVLRYFYLRGVVHWHSNHGDLAVRCWRTCLCIPADLVSEIALAAWKKLVLVQTLRQVHVAESDPLALPQPVPPVLSRYLQTSTAVREASGISTRSTSVNQPRSGSGSTTSSNENNNPEDVVHLVDTLETMGAAQPPDVAAYAELVLACVRMDAPKANDVLQRHTAVFAQDGNLGLAQQVAATVPWIRRVLAESRVYSVIAVQELAALVNVTPDDLVRLVTHLATTYSWSVQITPDGWVHFPPWPVKPMGDDDLAQATAELMALQQTVQKMDVTLSASAKFRSLTENTSAKEAGGGKDKGSTGPRGVEDV